MTTVLLTVITGTVLTAWVILRGSDWHGEGSNKLIHS